MNSNSPDDFAGILIFVLISFGSILFCVILMTFCMWSIFYCNFWPKGSEEAGDCGYKSFNIINGFLIVFCMVLKFIPKDSQHKKLFFLLITNWLHMQLLGFFK